MIPLRDHNPTRRFPFINYLLIIFNVAICIYTYTLSLPALEDFFNRFALTPTIVFQGENLLSFLTSMFLHAGLGHLLGNMLFLHIFGDNLEDYFGHFRYLLFYLACGLAADFAQIFVDPTSTIPQVGASGAIAGVMGAYLLLYPQHRIDILFSFGWWYEQTTLPAWTMLFYWFLAQLLTGVGSLGMVEEGGVAYFAHLGGFLAGMILVKIAGGRKRAAELEAWKED